MLDGQPREWHIWDFPDEIRVCFSVDFRVQLFRTLKKIYGSRYGLAKILELHPMTVKEYELGESTYGRVVFIPVFVLKKLVEILRKSEFSSLIDEIEKHITRIRLKGGRSLLVYHPILPIKESEQLYSFAAHMIGDGCASKESTPFYCGLDKELIKSFKKDLRVFGKLKTEETVREDGIIYLRFPTVIARIVQYLFDVKFTKPDRIPSYIFTSLDKYKIAFIRAFFDDEGSITGGKIYLTQKSKTIMEQIKFLLKPLGVETGKIMETQTKAHRFVIKTASYERFYTLIKFEHVRKKRRFEELIIRRISKPIPIKHSISGLLKKSYPLTKYDIASVLDLRIESVEEALSSLHEEDKVSCQYVSSRKPSLWYPKALYVG